MFGRSGICQGEDVSKTSSPWHLPPLPNIFHLSQTSSTSPKHLRPLPNILHLSQISYNSPNHDPPLPHIFPASPRRHSQDIPGRLPVKLGHDHHQCRGSHNRGHQEAHLAKRTNIKQIFKLRNSYSSSCLRRWCEIRGHYTQSTIFEWSPIFSISWVCSVLSQFLFQRLNHSPCSGGSPQIYTASYLVTIQQKKISLFIVAKFVIYNDYT